MSWGINKKQSDRVHQKQDRKGGPPVGPSDAARVDEPLALVLIDLVFVSVAGDQNVHVHLALHHGQTVRVAPWDDLVAVDEAYLKLSDLDDFTLWEALVVVEAAVYDVHVGGQSAQRTSGTAD